MLPRNCSKSFSFIINNHFRKYSNTSAPLVNLCVNEATGIATATLQRSPVNSLNVELLSDILTTLTDLEKNKCKGLILTSSFDQRVFSAGLDLREVYKPDVSRLKKLWTTLHEVWINLYGASYPTVAVINGHAPAGGCLLSISCDYRIMLKNFRIGLNETQVGIVVPMWLSATMRNTIGLRQAELALTTSRLFTTDEALEVGLIDEVASDKEEGLKQAEQFLLKIAKISPQARYLTKKSLRGTDIQDLINNRQKDLDEFISCATHEDVQKGLKLYLESLKKKN